MCIVAAPVLSLALTAVSTAVGVMGSIQQGKAAQAQANYQAQVSENNAKITQWQAQDAIARGKVEEEQHRKQVARFLGTQRAGIAGSGFELGDETSMSILGDTAAMGELDALTIRSNAAREAWGYQVQGSNFQADAGMSRLAGKNARSSSYWQAGGDLLSGASRFGTQYADFKSKGLLT